MKTNELPEGRRGFLTGAIYAIASVIGGALCAPAAVYLFGRRKSSERSRWVDAGELKQIPVGTPREISFRRNETDGWKIHSAKETAWILKEPDGKLVAFGHGARIWGARIGGMRREGSSRAPAMGRGFRKTAM